MASIFCALDALTDGNLVEHLDEIQNRIKFPNSYKIFTKTALRTSKILRNSKENISADDVYEIIQATDAFRNPEDFALIMEFHNHADHPDLKIKIILDAFDSCKDIGYDKDSFEGLEGDAIKSKLDALRIEKINSTLK